MGGVLGALAPPLVVEGAELVGDLLDPRDDVGDLHRPREVAAVAAPVWISSVFEAGSRDVLGFRSNQDW